MPGGEVLFLYHVRQKRGVRGRDQGAHSLPTKLVFFIGVRKSVSRKVRKNLAVKYHTSGLMRTSRTSGLSPLRVFPEHGVYPHLDHAKECLSENAGRHLGNTFRAVSKDNRHLHDLETVLNRCVFHFDLEGVTDEFDLIKLDSFQY